MCGQNSLELINQLSKENLDQYCNKEDLELLIINILDIDRNFLYRENPTLNENQTILLKKSIVRRNLGERLAYILGNKGLWNLDLLKLLDLGTGSGAIGISLFSERPSWNVYCSDLSYDALQVALENKKNNQVKVYLIHANWLNAFCKNSFDVIVSNPPYVDQNDERLLEDGVSFEPLEALVAQEGGLKDIKHIILNAKKYLRDNGSLLIEHAPEQSKDVIDLFENNAYKDIRQFKDLNGDDRVSFGKIIKK